MCDEHRGHGYGYPFMSPFSRCMCGCHEQDGVSNETRVKYLEAMKANLEDRIKHIDDRIDEIQKGDAQKA
ncbi:MAG: hypothetical protein ACFFEW_07045 [Candidatus Thorarchaeota archaeon]